MASLRDFEKRIERLEVVYSPPQALLVTLINYVSPLQVPVLRWKSYSHPDYCVERLPGESEEALEQRGRAEAQAHHRLHPSGSNCITLYSQREGW